MEANDIRVIDEDKSSYGDINSVDGGSKVPLKQQF